jgi:Pyruvate/2-oxoacid:ferredoxin oxidoreductase delta subunit
MVKTMKNETPLDSFLEKRLTRYDRWMTKGQIAFSSRVIPVAESLAAKKWVMPTEQVLRVIEAAESIALQDCECRTHYKRCENPLEVCLLLNEVGDKTVAQGNARHVSLEEATDVLKKANQSGLVHMSLYMPDHEVFALCSCCPCCCHDLQIVKRTGRNDIMMRSEYVAVTDSDNCIHCGDCEERCLFDARSIQEAGLEFNSEKCVGCGLCVTICPVEAISMVARPPGNSAQPIA